MLRRALCYSVSVAVRIVKMMLKRCDPQSRRPGRWDGGFSEECPMDHLGDQRHALIVRLGPASFLVSNDSELAGQALIIAPWTRQAELTLVARGPRRPIPRRPPPAATGTSPPPRTSGGCPTCLIKTSPCVPPRVPPLACPLRSVGDGGRPRITGRVWTRMDAMVIRGKLRRVRLGLSGTGMPARHRSLRRAWRSQEEKGQGSL